MQTHKSQQFMSSFELSLTNNPFFFAGEIKTSECVCVYIIEI